MYVDIPSALAKHRYQWEHTYAHVNTLYKRQKICHATNICAAQVYKLNIKPTRTIHLAKAIGDPKNASNVSGNLQLLLGHPSGIQGLAGIAVV